MVRFRLGLISADGPRRNPKGAPRGSTQDEIAHQPRRCRALPSGDCGRCRRWRLSHGGSPGTSAQSPDLSSLVEQYAEFEGVSEDEAGRRIAVEAAAGELEVALTSAIPSSFGGLFVEHEPRFGVVVLTTQMSDADQITALAASVELGVEVDIRQVKSSLRKLRADVAVIAKAVAGRQTSTSTSTTMSSTLWF